MNEQTLSRIEQVRTELQAGNTSRKIIEKFSEEWNVSERTIERIISVARTFVAKEREEEEQVRALVRQKHYRELEEQQIKNEKELDEILMNIARGGTKVKKIFNTAKGLEEREVDMNPDTVIRAINTYYKRVGARVKEQQKEKETIEKPDPFLDWEIEELEQEEKWDNNINKPAAYNEEENKVQSRAEEETLPLAATAFPLRDTAQHVGDTVEETMEKEKQKEKVKEKQKGEENMNVNVKESTIETKRNTHAPRTGTFNKWAIPFMPQQHYRRQQRVRVKNYPVK